MLIRPRCTLHLQNSFDVDFLENLLTIKRIILERAMFVYTGKYSDRIMEESHPQGSYFFFSSSLF